MSSPGDALYGRDVPGSTARTSGEDLGKRLYLPSPETVHTGGSRLVMLAEGHRVWTKKIGHSPIKVLLLHGGPGADHQYFECFESFLPQNGIEFYYYDQLDSTNSDKPGDPALWTLERFREEVEQVRQQLGLENFYLYGQSWGGILAIEYALKYQGHLAGLVISNMTASTASYAEYMIELRSQLPADVVSTLDKFEAAGQVDTPEYQEALMGHVYSRHFCRLDTWPEPCERGFRNLNQQLYNFMWGPNEFAVTGSLKGWDRWQDLPGIRVRTLVMGARYDTIAERDIRRENSLIPNSSVFFSESGSHLTLYDDQRPYMKALIGFLTQ
jgi:proline iminopeptidase